MFGKNRNSKGAIGLGKKAMVIFMCYSLVFSTFIPVLMAAEIKSLSEMKHNPPKYFVPDHRIQLDADVSDPAGVELVRCYFKAAGEADFVFVPMANTEKNDYAGILPAPSPATEQIEYLFLAVNRNNEVVKSQSFIINREEKKEAPAWQEIAKEGEIQVSMELDQVPAELAGFSDSIAMNAVESGLRFGVVAGGLYLSKAGESASVSGKAAAATNAGTITAGKPFNSAILAVVLGGAALAGAGGGGGGGGAAPAEALTEQTILERWNVTGSSTTGMTTSGHITFIDNGTFSYDLSDSGTGTGTWSLAGTYLTMNFDKGAIYEGQASGDSQAFTLKAINNPWTLNFRR